MPCRPLLTSAPQAATTSEPSEPKTTPLWGPLGRLVTVFQTYAEAGEPAGGMTDHATPAFPTINRCRCAGTTSMRNTDDPIQAGGGTSRQLNKGNAFVVSVS